MKTYRQALVNTEDSLINAGVVCGHGYDSEHDEAVALVLAAAGLPDDTGAEILDQLIPDAALASLSGFVQRRTVEREPTAYITGWAWLGPMKFRCDSRALVPRSPLMGVIADGFSPWWCGGGEPGMIVDLCCGGGSLGLLAAHMCPQSEVLLTDINRSALSLAEENRVLHHSLGVHLCQGDLMSHLAPASVDVILANPPYVDALDMGDLPAEYLHEPRLGLAAGTDGLDLVRVILSQAKTALRPGGLLFLEVGNSWPALEATYPDLALTWLTLEAGGIGVCVIEQASLAASSVTAAA